MARFKPGQSGNPKGRPPKSSCLTDALRELAGQPAGGGLSHSQKLARVLFRKAEAGDVRAAALIMDRVEGRPWQAVQVEASGIVPGLQFDSMSGFAAMMAASPIPRERDERESVPDFQSPTVREG